MSAERPLPDDEDESDRAADAELRASAERRRRLIVGGAAVLVVAIIALGTVLGGSIRDVPWLAVAGILILLAAIWRLEGRRLGSR